ncbi:MAG: ATP-binding cassette domain-containing protein [Desulfovibrio sp.]|nr:ATP-binding cassette domain-containing protein [Desulfovibrio sp.]
MWGEKRQLRAVDGVDLNLRQGECVGLVGESGCGKSTLGRMACGLLSPSEGSLFFSGQPLPPAGSDSRVRGRLQMIFQDPFSSLNPRMRVLDSVAEPLRALGKDPAEGRSAAADMLARVGLDGLGGRYPHEFSGGQRQRVCIARALLTRPDLVVLDEPVSALDASVQAQILNLLCDLRDAFSPSYLFISHDLRVVGFMCQRVMVMYLGRILEEGPRDALFHAPAHPYTRALLAAGEGRRDGSGHIRGELPSPIDPPKGCFFHPRCPQACDICRRTFPDWRTVGDGWRVRCHAV